MGLIHHLIGKKIALDTSVFIYFIEEHPKYFSVVEPVFEMIDTHAISAITSVLSLSEVLVIPFRSGDIEMAKKYKEILLGSNNLKVIELTAEIAELSANLRSKYQVRTPDAIHLATAEFYKADAFITNDSRLINFTPVPVIMLDSLLSDKK